MRELVLAIGRTGCGKTFKLAAEVRRRVACSPGDALVLIHDTRLRSGSAWDASALGALAPERARFSTVADLLAASNEGYPARVCAVFEDDPCQVFRLADYRRREGKHTIVAIDELTLLPAQLHRERPEHAAVHACLHFGRVGPVDVYATTQQPQRIDSAWLALATRVHLFSVSGDLQLQRIAQQGWPESKRLVSQLPKLKQREHVTIEPGG